MKKYKLSQSVMFITLYIHLFKTLQKPKILVLKGIMEKLYPNSSVLDPRSRKPEVPVTSPCKGTGSLIEGENLEHGSLYSLGMYFVFHSSSKQEERKKKNFAFQLTIIEIFFKFNIQIFQIFEGICNPKPPP